jgi:hypothetical protein
VTSGYGHFSAACRAAGLACLLMASLPSPGWAHGDLHVQIEAVSAKLRADPRNAALLFHRAELYRDHEQWPLAAADYDAVERLAPGQASVHLGRGKLLLATGRFALARAELDRFLQQAPGNPDALSVRGNINRAESRNLEASADFAAAIAAAPEPDAEWYLAQADALAAAGLDHQDEALAVLDAGSARLGHPVVLGLRAVELEQARGNTDAALVRLDALRAGQSRQETWLERRGNINAVASRNDDARRDWQAARDALESLAPRLAQTGAMRELRARLARKLASPAAL